MRGVASGAGCAVVLGFALVSSAATAEPASWTGFYIGGHVGMAAGSAPATFEDGTTWDGFGFRGAEAGAFAGVSKQVGRLVFGVEADGSWLDLGNIDYDGTRNAFVHWTTAVDGRAGVLLSPSTLLYGKLGWGVIGFDVPTESYLYPGGGEKALNGIQAAIGMEAQLGGNLRARVEAAYTKALESYFSTDGTYAIDVKPDTLAARFGLAFAIGEPAAQAADPAPGMSWSGFYLGGQAGWGVADTREDYLEGPLSGAAWNGFGASSGSLGGFVGLNHQIDRLVLGVELSGAWLGLANNESYDPNLNWGSTQWIAALDARAGILLNPATLVYAKAGGALLGFESNYAGYPGGPTDTAVLHAAQVGIGMEGAIAPNWTARVEGLYTQALEGFEFDGGGQNHSFVPQIVSGTVGLAYRY